jgi:hypothetical protein
MLCKFGSTLAKLNFPQGGLIYIKYKLEVPFDTVFTFRCGDRKEATAKLFDQAGADPTAIPSKHPQSPTWWA